MIQGSRFRLPVSSTFVNSYPRARMTLGFEFDKEFAGLLNSGDMLTRGQSKLLQEDS